MQKDKQLVTIKGTAEGFVFDLDDEHLFEDVLHELSEKLDQDQTNGNDDQLVAVVVKLGYRFLTKEQKTRLTELIEATSRFYIERFDSEVISKNTARLLLDKTDIKLKNQIVRSGQILDITGDLLLIGDVNPGGEVRATGNIFIMGQLQGIAHAGKNGDEQAVIVASYMNPSQLRIGKYFSRAPDYNSDGVYMECGYLDEEKQQIMIDRLQVLPYVRKELRNLERRILYG